ncbi:hypothetical protein GIHI108528_04070 [Gillisia hiemivivida]
MYQIVLTCYGKTRRELVKKEHTVINTLIEFYIFNEVFSENLCFSKLSVLLRKINLFLD